MKAELKTLNRNQIRPRSWPYEAEDSALERLWKIFRTGNVGRFKRQPFFTPPTGAAGMGSIRVLLSPFATDRTRIPDSRRDFDEWAREKVELIAKAYSDQAPYPLGIAQKTLNLFLKDLWTWNKLTDAQEECLHAPIDRIIIQKFKKPPRSWMSWSLVKWTTPEEFTALWGDYIKLQELLRARAELLSTPAAKLQPIMLEQILWGTI